MFLNMLKDKILKLYNQGKKPTEISRILKCSRGVIHYHISSKIRKSYKRRQKKRRDSHPLISKINSFLHHGKSVSKKDKKFEYNEGYRKILYYKLRNFCRTNNKEKCMKPPIKVQEVIDKFGENPICYLTGKKIDLLDPSSYQLDHIIPISQGGSSTIDNMEITCPEANISKSNMTDVEFIELCKRVVKHNKDKEQ